MVNFRQARQIVLEQAGPMWRDLGGQGEFITFATGLEDDAGFLVVGTNQAVIDGDPSQAVFDWPNLFVDRRTGLLTMLPPTDPAGDTRIENMTPITDSEDTER